MVTDERVAELLNYVRFDPADASRLRALHPHAVGDFERIASAFYERIREHEEAHAVFTGEAQIDRLRRSMVKWLDRLLGGTYDRPYYEQTARIGQAHVRVGLQQRYMFTAMALIRLELERIIDARVDAAELEATRAALHRALDVELAVMLEAYRDAYIERIERRQELEKEELADSLARTERRYMTAVELARELIVGLDPEGVIRLFNKGAEEVSGYGREEVVGSSFAQTFLLVDSLAAFAASLRSSKSGDAVAVDMPLRTRSGRVREVRWQISSTASKGGEVIETFLIGHDETDERANDERIRQTEKLAAIGTLAAGLAHEIRNPLNGAQLHVSYLERSLRKAGFGKDQLEAVEVVGDEIKRLAALVTEFLDFARPKPLARKETALCTICDRVAPLLAPAASAAHVQIVRDFPDTPLVASVDAAKMEQVLLNLGQNAIEALAPAGGGTVTMRVRRLPRAAIVEVEDDGPGLPSKEAPIFDAFYSTKAQGTGLGLAITHRIVTDHGGTIDASSKPGHTIFRITLPLQHEGMGGR